MGSRGHCGRCAIGSDGHQPELGGSEAEGFDLEDEELQAIPSAAQENTVSSELLQAKSHGDAKVTGKDTGYQTGSMHRDIVCFHMECTCCS
jgi:hypothetical protein